MKMSKIKKLLPLLTLAITLVSSLMVSTVCFADVFPGPNSEYSTITHVSGNGNSWNSTVNKPQYATWGTVGTDISGNKGGVPVVVEYSANCQSCSFLCFEVDSTGKQIGGQKFSPDIQITNKGTQYGINTQEFLLPASWFTEGKVFKVYSFGSFPNLDQSTRSSVFFYMVN
ncbi:hypothetical protein [Clostridium tagluense]|uniref:hypothetical protein n=1 Tax=Clostridium tagluense TaxID=360422 RepID=UPI001C6EB0D4|nr:hypothetical protein [Clostridium tagluense]MBW9156282.1 hypothetical protein [Clostridium tagluense]WLC64302.1 hypothetical protein KTC93_15680 [Clostridium tagluense]